MKYEQNEGRLLEKFQLRGSSLKRDGGILRGVWAYEEAINFKTTP